MDSKIKVRLSLYGFISAISYIYLVLTSKPGISIPIFIIVQGVSIFLIVKNRKEVKNKKGILVMLPIFILSLNNFISGSNLWWGVNYFVIIILYSVMILVFNDNLTLQKLNLEHGFHIVVNIFKPFANFKVPFKWCTANSKNETKRLFAGRILIGVLISIPCVIFLIIMLSSADMIFYESSVSLSSWITSLFNFIYVYKFIIGSIAGLYLFGHLYSLFIEKEINQSTKPLSDLVAKKVKGDVIVSNILLVSILLVYTIFIGIQFKYLFAEGSLPYGLNYSEYARRGFFELVFLSILNIALILMTTYLLKDKIYIEKCKWAQITKFMMIYLCILTGIMLISSFYRMMLYDNEYGFTRLRILVYLFLIFEALGLVTTLIYIIKHNFNILAVYSTIGLIYYLTLNIIQIDNIIAKRNIDMYFAGQTETIDMNYLMSLSIDAAPQIMRLLSSDVEIITKTNARIYLDEINSLYNDDDISWRSYNLSIDKTRKLLNEN